jgi:1A family penicillin-binding protein
LFYFTTLFCGQRALRLGTHCRIQRGSADWLYRCGQDLLLKEWSYDRVKQELTTWLQRLSILGHLARVLRSASRRIMFRAFNRQSLVRTLRAVFSRFAGRRLGRQRAALILAGGLAVICVVGYFALSSDLPSPDTLIQRSSPDSTKIYDRTGRLLFEVLDPRAGRRTRVALGDLPPAFREAVVAVEDANFYQHPGVDPVAILRTFWYAMQEDRFVSGGSTITQQLARQLLLSQEEREERTIQRKMREMILALRLNQTYTKDTILEMYVNEVYYGQLAYGIEAAARTYFGKPAHELDLAEASLLAGLIQSPSAYNPLVNPDAAKARQGVVLGLMVKDGFLTSDEATLAKGEVLHFAGTNEAANAPSDPAGTGLAPAHPVSPFLAPHFVVYVRNLLEAMYGDELVNHGGLRVITTLDLDMQQQAERVVRSRLDDLARRTREGGEPDYNVHDAALVAMNPANGDILAMVGSADYFDKSIDGAVNVALAERQPGSAIKPVTYATAFGRDYTPATVLSDVPTTFTTREGEPYQPQNYDTTWHGPISLRQALATSSNMIAVKVLDHVGLNAMIGTARALGITSFDSDERFGLSLTLGGGEVTLLELTTAYGGFANGGKRVTPRVTLDVRTTDSRQQETEDDTSPNEVSNAQAVSPQIAYLISSILSDDGARIPAFGEESVLKLSRPAAAKTGTTTDFRDNWTIGYTPNLVTGVWVGSADNAPMYKTSGITGAGPIWHDFMEAALAGQPIQSFERPDGLVDAQICDTSGLLATDACPRKRSETFIAGTEPIRRDDSYQSLAIDLATGLLWADGCAGPRVERTFHMMPVDAVAWGIEQGIERPPTSDCKSQISNTKSQVQSGIAQSLVIVSPARNATFALTSSLPPDTQRVEIAARAGTSGRWREITLLVDGQPVGTFSAEPYRALWPLRVGTHTVQAVGLDEAGQQVQSDVVQFTVQ